MLPIAIDSTLKGGTASKLLDLSKLVQGYAFPNYKDISRYTTVARVKSETVVLLPPTIGELEDKQPRSAAI
jgi:hypothetical protein